MDQAAGLREMMEGNAVTDSAQAVRVVAFTSGKGGVGKTSLALNLGILLQRMGRKVMLLDADLGLANVDIMLGRAPRWTLAHVLRGERTLEEIVMEGPEGMQILPAASGVEEMTRLTQDQKVRLLEQVDGWSRPVDTLFVDTAAGLGDNVLHFNLSAQESVVVVTPEPTSITDAYALIKVLSENHGVRRFRMIMNMVKSEAEARQLFERFLEITDRFLDVALDPLGHVLADRAVSRAIRRQRALVDVTPNAEASACLHRIARRLDSESTRGEARPGGLSFFWRRLALGAA